MDREPGRTLADDEWLLGVQILNVLVAEAVGGDDGKLVARLGLPQVDRARLRVDKRSTGEGDLAKRLVEGPGLGYRRADRHHCGKLIRSCAPVDGPWPARCLHGGHPR